MGWGRPVPLRSDRVRGGRRGLTAVHLAGPVANLAVAVICALLFGLTNWEWLRPVGLVNLTLFAFNLLPLPGLDGGRLFRLAWSARVEERNG